MNFQLKSESWRKLTMTFAEKQKQYKIIAIYIDCYVKHTVFHMLKESLKTKIIEVNQWR